MSSMEQQDERRILGQMVRFQNQAAVRIDNDCVNGLGGTSLRSQGQDKENNALFRNFEECWSEWLRMMMRFPLYKRILERDAAWNRK